MAERSLYFYKMVLIIAVAIGLICGLINAKINGRSYQPVTIKSAWLVIVAYMPQMIAFNLKFTRAIIPDSWIPAILIFSQSLLLIFVWQNRKLPGGWSLGLGLLSNFLAISLNGGMMPLLPENAAKLLPANSTVILQLGERVGFGKDILLNKADTRLWFLGDIFMLPDFFRYPLAFSIGDILISGGAFWLLCRTSSPHLISQEVSQ